MTNEDVDDTIAMINRMLDVMASLVPKTSGRRGSDLRRAIGELRVTAEHRIRTADMAAGVENVFTALRMSGVNLAHMEKVRLHLLDEVATGNIMQAVLEFCIRAALRQDARIVRDMAYRSRNEVEAIIAQMHQAFTQAEEVVADQLASQTYRLLIALHASVTRFLVDRARPLPRVVNYKFADYMPSLTLAHKIYGDAARAAELIVENNVIHPLFMPPTGRALSR
jgi:prophage DNA circulation protein